MDTIIFATGNKNKMIEIRMILADLGCKILSQKEAGIQADVVEDGQTFEENALIKATTIADIARKMPEYKNAVVLADDSGLEIDALNKEPGIYSARYMGEDTSYDIKNQALIDRLEGVPDEKGLDKVEAMKQTYYKLCLDCLVILGGNGTQKTANLLREEGLNIVVLDSTPIASFTSCILLLFRLR